jgi:hypothetical protein
LCCCPQQSSLADHFAEPPDEELDWKVRCCLRNDDDDEDDDDDDDDDEEEEEEEDGGVST